MHWQLATAREDFFILRIAGSHFCNCVFPFQGTFLLSNGSLDDEDNDLSILAIFLNFIEEFYCFIVFWLVFFELNVNLLVFGALTVSPSSRFPALHGMLQCHLGLRLSFDPFFCVGGGGKLQCSWSDVM